MSLIKGSTVRIALSTGTSNPARVVTGVLVDNKYDTGGSNIASRIFAVESGSHFAIDKVVFQAGGKSYGLLSVRRNKFRCLVKQVLEVSSTKTITDEFAEKFAENDPTDAEIKDLNHLVVELTDPTATVSTAGPGSSTTNTGAAGTVITNTTTTTDPVVLMILKELKDMKSDHNELVQKLTENSAEIPPLKPYNDGDCLKAWKPTALRWETECLKAGIRKGRMLTHFLDKIKGTCGSTVKSSDKYNLDTLESITPILNVLESKVHGSKDEQFHTTMTRWEEYSWDKLPEIISKKKREERRGLPDEPTMFDHKQEISDIRKEVEVALSRSSTNTAVSNFSAGTSGSALSLPTSTGPGSIKPVNFGERYWGYYFLRTLMLDDEDLLKHVRLSLNGNYDFENVATIMSHSHSKIKVGSTKSDGSIPLSGHRVTEDETYKKMASQIQSLTDKVNYYSGNFNGNNNSKNNSQSSTTTNNGFKKKKKCQFGTNCKKKGNGCNFWHPGDKQEVKDDGGRKE